MSTTEQSPTGTEPQERADVEHAKAMLRAALEVLTEKPPPKPSNFGKAIDYINDFSLSYLFDEVAFKQKELKFKENEAGQKEKRFNFDKPKFKREHAKEEFMRGQARERVAFAQSLLDVGRYSSASRLRSLGLGLSL